MDIQEGASDEPGSCFTGRVQMKRQGPALYSSDRQLSGVRAKKKKCGLIKNSQLACRGALRSLFKAEPLLSKITSAAAAALCVIFFSRLGFWFFIYPEKLY